MPTRSVIERLAEGLMDAPLASTVVFTQRERASPEGADSSSTWATGRSMRSSGLLALNAPSVNTRTVESGI